ncbi:hypothetical protein [Pedobacter cryoconitis]|uniref:SdpC family antimicrobial peptide n=1 Tax=Pedobacter cryoconitis TaxID=188932 RepID=A0A327S2H4_9SPHI|nr:hypothetical protein [Pedobacter cryoconitis]RAJ19877.1 SdpC family antimicrobial peptide [Pedobacter cryoconitis]
MKRKIFKGIKIKYIILSTGLLVGLFLGFRSDDSKTVYHDISNTITGETLFKGIFFGDQKISQFLPELNTIRAAKESSDNNKIVTQLLHNINKINPIFFDTFKSNIESGDPNLVDQSLINGMKIIDQILNDKRIFNQKKENMVSPTNDIPQTGEYFVVSPVLDVPGPLMHMVTQYTDSDPSLLAKKGIEREKLVAYLTDTLKK